MESLPNTQQPEVFGLHANADITKDLNQTEEMLTSLIATGGASGGGGNDAHQAATVAGIVQDILKQLPPDFDIEATQTKYPVSYSQSMNQVKNLISLTPYAHISAMHCKLPACC